MQLFANHESKSSSKLVKCFCIINYFPNQAKINCPPTIPQQYFMLVHVRKKLVTQSMMVRRPLEIIRGKAMPTFCWLLLTVTQMTIVISNGPLRDEGRQPNTQGKNIRKEHTFRKSCRNSLIHFHHKIWLTVLQAIVLLRCFRSSNGYCTAVDCNIIIEAVKTSDLQ